VQSFRLDESRADELVRRLAGWGAVWAPVETAPGSFSLQPVDDPSRARPDALRTALPFKKLLLPPSFAMLSGGFGAAHEIDDDPTAGTRGRVVLYGAHPCDIHALRVLDLLHLSGHADPYYAAGRERLLVVGYGCWPDEHCFCESLATDAADDGFDLFLTPLDGRFLVTVASSLGDEVVRANEDLFVPATATDIDDSLSRLRRRSEAFRLRLDTSDLPYILELKKDDPVWDEIAQRCLCCGSCSMVCPTCSCFNVADRIDDHGRASRIRSWDSCLFRDYASVAGGHSFRADRADRVRTRY